MSLVKTIKIKDTTLEFIQHNTDNHKWLYINGCLTDCKYSRALDDNVFRLSSKPRDIVRILRSISTGSSEYNKTRIANFIRDVIDEDPQDFI